VTDIFCACLDFETTACESSTRSDWRAGYFSVQVAALFTSHVLGSPNSLFVLANTGSFHEHATVAICRRFNVSAACIKDEQAVPLGVAWFSVETRVVSANSRFVFLTCD